MNKHIFYNSKLTCLYERVYKYTREHMSLVLRRKSYRRAQENISDAQFLLPISYVTEPFSAISHLQGQLKVKPYVFNDRVNK